MKICSTLIKFILASFNPRIVSIFNWIWVKKKDSRWIGERKKKLSHLIFVCAYIGDNQIFLFHLKASIYTNSRDSRKGSQFTVRLLAQINQSFPYVLMIIYENEREIDREIHESVTNWSFYTCARYVCMILSNWSYIENKL